MLLYRFEGDAIEAARDDAASRLTRLLAFRHPHALGLRHVQFEPERRLWIVAEYAGSHAGVLTLARLLSQKDGGRLVEGEARHAIGQVLFALAAAHAEEIAHGSLKPDDVLVDPRGRTIIELLGVERALAADAIPFDAAARADLRAVALLASELLTGVAESQEAPAPTGDRAWDRWLEVALVRGRGFVSAADALSALPRSPR